MAEALGVAPDRLTLVLGEALPGDAAAAFERMLEERARARPVAQILGRRALLGAGVRGHAAPSSIRGRRPRRWSRWRWAGAGPARILDLGTGSGAILVTLLAEWPEARGVGTDIDAAALAVAAENAARHGVAARATFRRADWTEGVVGRFDLVVSNPPYIPAAEVEGLAADVRDWEPRHALTAGPTGLEAYRRIAAGLGRGAGAGRAGRCSRSAPGRARRSRRSFAGRGGASRPRRAGPGGGGGGVNAGFSLVIAGGDAYIFGVDPATMSEFIRVTPGGSDTCTDTPGRRMAADAAAGSASPQPQWRKPRDT